VLKKIADGPVNMALSKINKKFGKRNFMKPNGKAQACIHGASFFFFLSFSLGGGGGGGGGRGRIFFSFFLGSQSVFFFWLQNFAFNQHKIRPFNLPALIWCLFLCQNCQNLTTSRFLGLLN